MATYDLVTLTETPAAQFDGTADSLADLQAICSEARLDPTMEPVVTLPIGGSHGARATMHKGDWLVSVEGGEYLVLPDASFAAMFEETP